jgi:hypothetical protein
LQYTISQCYGVAPGGGFISDGLYLLPCPLRGRRTP